MEAHKISSSGKGWTSLSGLHYPGDSQPCQDSRSHHTPTQAAVQFLRHEQPASHLQALPRYQDS